jgi:hypothetical protein
LATDDVDLSEEITVPNEAHISPKKHKNAKPNQISLDESEGCIIVLLFGKYFNYKFFLAAVSDFDDDSLKETARKSPKKSRKRNQQKPSAPG